MRNSIGAWASAAALTGALCITSIPAPARAQTQTGQKASAPKAGPTPRLPDGHPDLGNGKGSWDLTGGGIGDMAGTGGGFAGRAQPEHKIDVPFQSWAKKLYDERNARMTKDDPEGMCLPPGIPRMIATAFPFQIYQLPDRVMFVFEGGAHMWRVVYTDGRKHTPPDQWNPTYLGEGIGHWEGDTLVVDVTGFNDKTWIDAAGHPHTEALHVVERYTRTDSMTLHYEAMIEDPQAYTKPWTTSWNVPFHPGWEPFEYICQENNADLKHLVGK
jgi:hypothetical protein